MAGERRVVVRSSTGLVDALFDSIDRLNNKEVTAEEARAVSHTAKSIVAIARLEMDFIKLSKDNKTDGLKSLVIEHADTAAT
jgi:hypothetical protein